MVHAAGRQLRHAVRHGSVIDRQTGGVIEEDSRHERSSEEKLGKESESSRIGASERVINRKLKCGGCDSLGVQYPLRQVRNHLNHVILNAFQGGNEA